MTGADDPRPARAAEERLARELRKVSIEARTLAERLESREPWPGETRDQLVALHQHLRTEGNAWLETLPGARWRFRL